MSIVSTLYKFSRSQVQNRLQLEVDRGEFEPTYLISTFPKCGSTYLMFLLLEVLGARRVSLIYDDYREQDLDYGNLLFWKNERTLSKHHTLATSPNIELLNKFQIRPIIITRKLDGVLFSLRRHILRTEDWPHFAIPDDFGNWSFEKQIDCLIHLVIPWYIHFYVSWSEYLKNQPHRAFITSYEEMVRDQESMLSDILKFLDFEINENSLKKAIQRINSRPKHELNMYSDGRLKEEEILNNQQRDLILKMTSFYPSIEFDSIIFD